MIRTIRKVDRRRKPRPQWEAPAANPKTHLQRIDKALRDLRGLNTKGKQ